MTDFTPRGTSRRELLKVATGVMAGVATPILPGRSSDLTTERGSGKILVAYFSRTGNTRDVANQIQQRIIGDIVEIKTVNPYPSEYKATTEQAKREQEINFRPPLTTEITNMNAYDTVFIGYPNWWSTLPMAFFTFLEKYDLSNKTVIPFCTHEGSYLGRSVTDLKTLCPNSMILEGLALRGGSSGYVKTAAAQRDVTKWLEKSGITL